MRDNLTYRRLAVFIILTIALILVYAVLYQSENSQYSKTLYGTTASQFSIFNPNARSSFDHNLNWASLSQSEQNILRPFENKWNGFSKSEKQLWLSIAFQYPQLSAEKQQILDEKIIKWSKMSAQEREVARKNYLASQRLSEEKKIQAWQAYQKLSANEKKQLTQQFKNNKRLIVSAPPSYYVYNFADTSSDKEATVPSVRKISPKAPTPSQTPLIPISPDQAMTIYRGS